MMQQYVPPGGVDRVPPYDRARREHYWIVALAHHVVDPVAFTNQTDGPAVLDLESLVSASGPGCYYCEQVWSERLGHRKCTGGPS